MISNSTERASPKSPRYFYTDALAAGWMLVHYGMQLECPKTSGDVIHAVVNRETHAFNVGHLSMRPHFKAYIRPESLHLLEPVIGDLVTNLGVAAWRVIGLCADTLLFADDCFARKHEARIIQRNGKAFHWPENEAI